MNTPTIKKLFLLAALPAAILVANNAMAGVDVYGKINVSTQINSADQDDGLVPAGTPTLDGDTYDNSTLESNASRFGIKGSMDLGDTGLKAVAKIEYEVFVDDGSDGQNNSGDELSQRNIYGGLQGNFGTVIAGNFDTPMKESQGKVDMFNDYLLGDIKNVLLVGENRAKNIVMYSTPKMENGFGAHFAVMSGEESGVDNTLTDATENSDLIDHISASVTYDSDMFYAALAHDTESPVTATAAGATITRLTGQMKLDAFTVGLIYQTAESAENVNAPANGIPTVGNELANSSMGVFNAVDKSVFGTNPNWLSNYEDQDGYILSTSYTLDKHIFKAQYGYSEAGAIVAGAGPAFTPVDDGDLEITMMTVGYDYMLDKKSKVYAYYSDYQAEHEKKTTTLASRETNADTFGVGFEYSF